MTKKENLLSQMRANPSLEPIAHLAELTDIAEGLARQAEVIGDRLSVFAVKGEVGKEHIQAIEAWEKLCDFYKHGARNFAPAIRRAVGKSKIDLLPTAMEDYNNSVLGGLANMYETDDKFRDMVNNTIQRRDENAENGPKNAE